TGLEDGIFPHSRSLEDFNQMEEERRLFYVGITRAMERLYLVHAFRRGFWGASRPSDPSRFLADIPPNLLKITSGGSSSMGSFIPSSQRAGPVVTRRADESCSQTRVTTRPSVRHRELDEMDEIEDVEPTPV